MRQIAFEDVVSGRRKGPGWGLVRLGLSAVSLPYRAAVAARNLAYDRGWAGSTRARVPVVSVGNLTLGGTGKTPCVEYVARLYRDHGLRVTILSRGYGGGGGPNDEALLLEENLPDVPHLQGKDRVRLAETAVEELECELIVLDDGFQHRRLARDLDVVVIDATNPWGHGHLFPRGTLREPPRGLRRAGAVVVTHCDQVPGDQLATLTQAVRKLCPGRPVVRTWHLPTALAGSCGEAAPLDRLRGRPVAGFRGIGNPAAFLRTLNCLGAEVVADRCYPDHHAYTREDVDDLRCWAETQNPGTEFVTTQKDAVKLRGLTLAGRPLWALRIELRPIIDEERAAFDKALLAVAPAATTETE